MCAFPFSAADERAAAKAVLDACKQLQPPLVATTVQVELKVVACALARFFGYPEVPERERVEADLWAALA